MSSIVIRSFTTGRQALSLAPIVKHLLALLPDTFSARRTGNGRGLGDCKWLLGAALCVVLTACSSDTVPGDTPPEINSLPPTGSNGSTSNDMLALHVGDGTTITLLEGATSAISIPVSIERLADAPDTVHLTAELQSQEGAAYTSVSFSDAALGVNETSSTLKLQLAIGARPIQAEDRTLIVTASDGSTAILSTSIDFSVTPTTLPDVYLLVGQSNMVGFSEDDSKQAEAGQADAPNDRILQLNVTGNDGSHFASAADFSNPTRNYVEGLPLSPAVDPLHDSYDESLSGKSGQRIGMALSFAKRALNDTNTNIYLVPAAWSDTGFCSRDTNIVNGTGWNATQKDNAALSGTLLYDRAITRANITLSETSGILRGILWHQGEADSDNLACAEAYASNLTELAAALRSNIQQDARGAAARGANADVPFIVGTLSQGSDERGAMTPFSDGRQEVDNVLRNIANLVPLSSVVINDDLVPPGYNCGEGSCIHFGASAYRIMGERYYEALIGLLP